MGLHDSQGNFFSSLLKKSLKKIQILFRKFMEEPFQIEVSIPLCLGVTWVDRQTDRHTALSRTSQLID